MKAQLFETDAQLTLTSDSTYEHEFLKKLSSYFRVSRTDETVKFIIRALGITEKEVKDAWTIKTERKMTDEEAQSLVIPQYNYKIKL